MRSSKKGAFALSVNAIVILILAIAILGLGLAFMTNIFGTAVGEFEEVKGAARKQMIDQMEQSERAVDMSRPKIELQPGDRRQLFMGFNNLKANDIDFNITNVESTPLEGVVSCGTTSASDVRIEYKKSATTVLKGDVVILPLNVVAKKGIGGDEGDVCFYELTIKYGNLSASPDTTKAELTVDIII